MFGHTDEVALVELSDNDGISWSQVFCQNGLNAAGETTFQKIQLDLSAFIGKYIRIRFRYTTQNWRYYASDNVGWYVDDIELLNTSIASEYSELSNLKDPVFNFTPSQPGIYQIAARARMYQFYPLDWGSSYYVYAIDSANK